MNRFNLDRITFDPRRMGGKPCIRDMQVTVGMVVACGYKHERILEAFPSHDEEDIRQALSYAAWRAAGACGQIAVVTR